MAKKTRTYNENLNFYKIQYFYEREWINWDEKNYLTIEQLFKKGAIKEPRYGVTLRKGGIEMLDKLKKPLFIEVSDIEPEAL